MRQAEQANLPADPKSKIDFDLNKDWGLIEASFIQDYGIRLTKKYLSSITFSEFSNLLNGLTKNTALSQQLMVRMAKKDKKTNKVFNKNKAELSVDWKDKKQRDMFFMLMRPRKK